MGEPDTQNGVINQASHLDTWRADWCYERKVLRMSGAKRRAVT
jgi:hypothetical protein